MPIAALGVVAAGFDPTTSGRTCACTEGWVLYTDDGTLYHAGNRSKWEGQPEGVRGATGRVLKEGDVVVRLPLRPCPVAALPLTASCVVQGLLLDCDAATLTVWVNGEPKGVMVRPGMTDDEDEPVARLEGPLRWAVDLSGYGNGTSVAVAGPLSLPD